MQSNEFVLSVFNASPDGKIIGRTRLQKICFLVNELVGRVVHYEPHYYGPYSAELADTVDQLLSEKQLSEDKTHLGEEVRFGTVYDVIRYIYEITESGKKTAHDVVKRHPEKTESINEAVSRIHQAPGGDDYKVLASASKVLTIIYHTKKKPSVESIRASAKNLNWDLSDADVQQAINFLSSFLCLEGTERDIS
jgi:uncharacterized protein YwgA